MTRDQGLFDLSGAGNHPANGPACDPPPAAIPIAHGRPSGDAGATEQAIARSTSHEDPAKREAMARLEAAFCDYLRERGVGRDFQTIAFLEWASATGREEPLIDNRALGGLTRRAANNGLVEAVGMRHTGGSRSRNNNSCPRTVWRVRRLPAGDRLKETAR